MMMKSKILKRGGAVPNAFEEEVSQAILELEHGSTMKQVLRELHITRARKIDCKHKMAILIYVPVPQLKAFHKIQERLTYELEKKFSGHHVVFCAERKILPKPRHGHADPNKQIRPRSRTLTSVYDAVLEDLVYPAEIIGKRIRYRLDGSPLYKAHLNKYLQSTIEIKPKLDTITAVYKKLTGRTVSFELVAPIH